MSVQSIERAFAVLRALATAPYGVTELAEQVDLPKSTVARLLGALESEGAVTQDEMGGEYRLGDGLLDIAGAAQPGRNLVATVRPFLLELSEEIGEAVGLGIAQERNVYYLDHAEPEADVMVRDWTGEALPMHSVPSGMALLAHMSPAEVDRYLAVPAEQVTPNTLVDPDAIRERLDAVRNLGYAWGYEEGVDGINSLAAPIIGGDGEVIAAIHVHGPAYRFPNPDRTHDLGSRLIEAAGGVAAQLVD
ncbi:MAG: IclR family transcriptional regulator [Actinomycetota bacterium]